MNAVDRFFRQHGIKIVLSLSIAVGVLGVLVFERDGPLPSRFFEHTFMALAVAGFIGLFIDLTLQRQIARNVFEAALGYLLPDKIRGELRWIYGQPFICEDHTQTVHLYEIEGTRLLRLNCEVTRDFKNISGQTQAFPPGLSIEENLHEEHPSRLINYTYQLDGEAKSNNCAEHLEIDSFGAGIRVVQDKNIIKPASVKSGEKIRVCFEYEKTFNENDFDYLHFGAPTTNVTVVVYAPDRFVADVLFSHRDGDPAVVKVGPHTWKLNAVLLPLQAIRIQWNLKDHYERWKSTALQKVITPEVR